MARQRAEPEVIAFAKLSKCASKRWRRFLRADDVSSAHSRNNGRRNARLIFLMMKLSHGVPKYRQDLFVFRKQCCGLNR